MKSPSRCLKRPTFVQFGTSQHSNTPRSDRWDPLGFIQVGHQHLEAPMVRENFRMCSRHFQYAFICFHTSFHSYHFRNHRNSDIRDIWPHAWLWMVWITYSTVAVPKKLGGPLAPSVKKIPHGEKPRCYKSQQGHHQIPAFTWRKNCLVRCGRGHAEAGD